MNISKHITRKDLVTISKWGAFLLLVNVLLCSGVILQVSSHHGYFLENSTINVDQLVTDLFWVAYPFTVMTLICCLGGSYLFFYLAKNLAVGITEFDSPTTIVPTPMKRVYVPWLLLVGSLLGYALGVSMAHNRAVSHGKGDMLLGSSLELEHYLSIAEAIRSGQLQKGIDTAEERMLFHTWQLTDDRMGGITATNEFAQIELQRLKAYAKQHEIFDKERIKRKDLFRLVDRKLKSLPE